MLAAADHHKEDRTCLNMTSDEMDLIWAGKLFQWEGALNIFVVVVVNSFKTWGTEEKSCVVPNLRSRLQDNVADREGNWNEYI